ncbi:MAG: pyridoxal-phosphate dependent enzyme [Deltaproteobacteria bacterium]|nr:pyridoxal-phosphate dependent enzyme [Deltaproteobacteria bacterium]
MSTPDLPLSVIDPEVRARTAQRLRRDGVILPTLSELADPHTIPAAIASRLPTIDPDHPHPLNLFRVHWYNDAERRGLVDVPGYLELPRALTGVAAPILVALGERFPLIGAHKVLAAYACLVPRLVTGAFDPARQRAVWPSTGNYCRGGVAISRMLDCRGVAVLPEGMSAERFAWLARWVQRPDDVIRTPGSESNVKEIYDACARLARDPDNVILNQFSEYANHLAHWRVTGPALAHVFRDWATRRGGRACRLRAFVSATGSAGTIGAGDYLSEALGASTVAVEAVECPTLIANGYGAHNIQGIGDKHVPLIHNVMGTDFVVGVSDRATDRLHLLFQSDFGREYLVARRGVEPSLVASLSSLGLSSVCNIVAAVKLARALDLGPDDAIVTVATDGAALYHSELDRIRARERPLDAVRAGEIYGEHLAGAGLDHLLELDHATRRRIFNLGYFTWVEQQGIDLDHFEARRKPAFWRGLRDAVPVWDHLIRAFNEEVHGGNA